MSTVHCLCGRICSGKTHYAAKLVAEGAVLLSCDTLTLIMGRYAAPETFDAMAQEAKAYLHGMAERFLEKGVDVVLDWGFWTQSERDAVTARYARAGHACRWYYMDCPKEAWMKNLADRQADVAVGDRQVYAVDAGLLQKLEVRFEVPASDTMDVWIENRR